MSYIDCFFSNIYSYTLLALDYALSQYTDMVRWYSDNTFELYVSVNRDDIFSPLTDTITLFAALAAIALPLAQQTFQWTSDKYRSENLVDYIESNSPIHPKKLNKCLILYTVVVFFFKLISPLLNNFLFFVFFSLIAIAFAINIYYLIKYLSHTYEMGRGLKGIRAKILSKQQNFDKDMYTDIEITILADYESYMLENDPLYLDFSPDFFKLRGFFYDRFETIDETIITAYVQGQRKALSSIPSTSSDTKYNNISHSYLFFVQSLICDNSKYFYLLNELAESAETNEPFRKSESKPLLQGMVFNNIIYKQWPKEGLAEVLVNHFKLMTQVCIDVGESEQLVQLYKNFNDSLGLSDMSEGELQYKFHSSIDSYDSFTLVDELVEKIIDTDSSVSKKESFVLEMTPLLKGTAEEKEELFDQFFSDLQTFNYQKKAKESFDSFLADAAKSDIKIVVAIRESQNPISSTVHMLGYSLMPISIEEIMLQISHVGLRFVRQIFLDNKHNQNLLKAYVTLLIYEVCKATKDGADINHYNFLNRLSYRELDTLRSKISEVNQLQIYLIDSECFVDLFILHAVDSTKINGQFSDYMEGLAGAIDQLLHKLSVEGKLDQKIIDRFLSEFPKNNEILEQYDYFFLNKVRFSQLSKRIYTLNFARSSFLSDTGSYHVFSGLGQKIIDDHFNSIYKYIFTESEGLEFEKTWPINHKRLILLKFEHKRELEKHGFKFIEDKMHWPNQTYCPYHLVTDDSDKIVNTLPNDTLVQVSDFNAPICEVKYIDKGEKILWEFTFNVMPCGYKH
jgi:hypothetical protein